MIDKVFQTKQPFIGFITGGDGGMTYSVECCLQLIAGGVDILEIGLPFSDPIADGPIIQKSSQRALAAGTTAATLLEMARQIRQVSDTPLVLFSYFNPLLQKGESFLKEAHAAGFNAVLTVDLPVLKENNSYFHSIKQAGLSPIYLVSPSTDNHRLSHIVSEAEGFIYYACQKGTTGIKSNLPDDFSFHINRLRQTTHLPIAAGFGIADRQSAQSALAHADGFVVGSAFVKLMEQKINPIELKKMAQLINPQSD